MTPTVRNTLILLLLAVIGFVVYVLIKKAPPPMACTMEAKLCSDGSYVGRQGPMCEFAACPGEGWKTYTDNEGGISFDYPETLGTTYIHTVDWPPKVSLNPGPFTCTEAGSETSRAGETKSQTIHGRTYCVTKITEGAAGSTYTQYAYAFADPDIGGDQYPILTFSLRFVQCGNYDDPEKTACENERAAFDINSTIDRIAQSLVVITGK
jgi:hypothetical protein